MDKRTIGGYFLIIAAVAELIWPGFGASLSGSIEMTAGQARISSNVLAVGGLILLLNRDT